MNPSDLTAAQRELLALLERQVCHRDDVDASALDVLVDAGLAAPVGGAPDQGYRITDTGRVALSRLDGRTRLIVARPGRQSKAPW